MVAGLGVQYLPLKDIHHLPIMPTVPPIYEERGETYQADACEPVARAVAEGAIRYRALVRGHYSGEKLRRGVLSGVRNLGVWNVELPQSWGLDWHRNEGIEITFLESGRLAFAVDDHDYQLQAGDLTFTRPWQRHRLGDPHITPSCLHWLILDLGVRRPHQSWRWPSWLVLTKADRDELTVMLRQAVDAVWHAHDEVFQCFRRIGDAVRQDQAGSSASRLAAYLNELFVLLLDLLRQGRVAFDHRLASAERTVELFWEDIQRDEMYLAHPWTVREMAERCGMGVTRFTSHCRRVTNLSPIEYLTRQRLEAAVAMLCASPPRSITDIAFSCGFSSSQYFAKVFRQRFGSSPTEYRRQIVR